MFTPRTAAPSSLPTRPTKKTETALGGRLHLGLAVLVLPRLDGDAGMLGQALEREDAVVDDGVAEGVRPWMTTFTPAPKARSCRASRRASTATKSSSDAGDAVP
jgi:hypothetical protein